jgi:zinc/manganese transport system ATP-binding protein
VTIEDLAAMSKWSKPAGGDPPRRRPIVSLLRAQLAFGDRVLWDDLDLAVFAGEFVAVLGPNGSGKTSLLKVLLGQLPLSAGVAKVNGQRITSGNARIGYVPQHRPIDREVVLRGRDLVQLGVDGRRWGGMPLRAADRVRGREAVDRALQQVNGEKLADVRVGVMSGGELQRVRIAQALASDPMLLLCDEPLLTLDPANAKLVSGLIDRRRREAGTTVMVVTHEVNPILPYVDRVLYIVDGRFQVGTVEQVMTSETLSALYQADIEVVKVRGRYVVVGDPVASELATEFAGHDGHDEHGGHPG